MDLNILWFCLITILFSGFFFLEGFDYGVGMLVPFLGKNDTERRVIVNSVGPFWDGNEVWLLTAGGAMFAAFPNWYATLFSGFYLALFLILAGLIIRGVAFEFRGSRNGEKWKSVWDWCLCIGSFLPALLWGVAVSNLIAGVPIGADMEYAGTFFSLLSPFTLLGGVVTFLMFLYYGACFLSLKVGDDNVLARCKKLANTTGPILVVVVVAWVVVAALQTAILTKPVAIVAVVLAAVCLLASVFLQRKGKQGWSFATVGLTLIFVTVTVFATMFPNVMISSMDPAYSLTIYNASSTPYTLRIMSIIAVTLVPVVLLYQAWNYWIFRKRVTKEDLTY